MITEALTFSGFTVPFTVAFTSSDNNTSTIHGRLFKQLESSVTKLHLGSV